MARFFVLLFSISLIAGARAGQDAAPAIDKSLSQQERSSEWLLAFEKLRTLPRPGELRTIGISANVGDVIESSPEQKAAIAAMLKEFDAAMVRKAAQWQDEAMATRAEYEAKVLAILPAPRRDAARKALALTHDQWAMPLEFEARLRADFIAKKEKADEAKKKPEEIDALRKEFQAWIREQRAKAVERDAELVKNLKALLDSKEAERLNEFDRNRVVPPKKK